MKCERCGKRHNGDFGSGRFCSISCSKARTFTDSTKEQTRLSVAQYYKKNPKPKPRHTCEKCGILFEGYVPVKRKKHCPKCRRKVPHVKEGSSILEYSKRTVSKILKRSKKGCSLCGWNSAACDIHHIDHRANGGNDDHDNLIVVCPNCHREIHEGVCQFPIEELRKRSIARTFKDWRIYYDPKEKYYLKSG
jgi:hypothetical protein